MSEPFSYARQPLRVLVVDDEALNREVGSAQLALLGHHADVAADGAEALRKLEAAPVDAVLMDCEMPVLDGYAAAREIWRRTAGTHRPWIIALTANPSATDRETCLAAGMDDFLRKPASLDALRAALDRIPGRAVKISASPADPLAALRPRLIALFLRDAPPRIAEMRHALDRGDLESLARAAHALKGSAANLGARDVVEASDALERRARSGHQEGIAENLAGLEAAFRRAHEELSSGA